MPRGDGTGPAGFGPMTGRSAGYCAGYSVPGYANSVRGRGFGRGWGRGFGRGRGWRQGAGFPRDLAYGDPYSVPYREPYYPTKVTPQQEADMLRGQANAIQEELKAVNERLNELENEAKKVK